MLRLFYHLLWTLVLAPCLPLALLAGKGRLRQRLGLSIPPGRPAEESVWIHALSVGEVVSAVPLVKWMREHHPRRPIVFTATTRQGMEIARREVGGEVRALLAMPLDCWWGVERLLRFIRPSVFLLVETDLWPGLLSRLRRKGVRAVLVNGRISPATFRSYRRFAPLTRRMFAAFDACLMQSDLDRSRLLRIGVPARKVRTVGNIKFDRKGPSLDREGRAQWLARLALDPGDRVWVAGSTHAGEERVVLDAFEGLRPGFPRLRLIIAPRRVERAEEVLELARRRGFSAALRTRTRPGAGPCDVLILDTLGELGQVYGTAEISFVGGSLVPVGGHNLLEPAVHGRPVLFGPHTHNFVLMSRMLELAGGGRRVRDGRELLQAMQGLLSDREGSDRMGERARAFVRLNTGALDRVVGYVETLLKG